jgi:hypothetical protein
MFAGFTFPTQRSILASLAIAGAIGLALVAGVVATMAPTSGRADEEVAPLSAKEVRGATP